MHQKMIMIGLDGCDFQILKPMIANGNLPFFQEILRGGSHGILKSTQPINTVPSWASIFTGVNPGKHGLIDFVFREKGEFIVASGRHRMVDTIWELLSKYNIRQIVVNDPISYPPSKINGIFLTGFLTPPGSTNFIYPAEIRDEVDKACGGYRTDLPFGFEETIAHDRSKGFELINDLARIDFETAKHLARNHEWDLLSLTFTSTDRLQHFYLDDEERMKNHYQMLDGMMREICELDSEANVMIMSDHGFAPLQKCFYVNSWLRERKYVKDQRSFLNRFLSKTNMTGSKIMSLLLRLRLYSILDKIVPDRIKRQVPSVSGESRTDYKNSSALLASADNGLYFNDLSILGSIRTELEVLMANNQNILQEIHLRDEVYWGEYSRRAPEITLLPAYGCEISPRLAQSWLEAPSKVADIRTGTHRPEGIFMAFGPNIRKTDLGATLRTWDIAPTVLHNFGVPAPEYMDGKVIDYLFETEIQPLESTGVVSGSYRSQLTERIRKLKKQQLSKESGRS